MCLLLPTACFITARFKLRYHSLSGLVKWKLLCVRSYVQYLIHATHYSNMCLSAVHSLGWEVDSVNFCLVSCAPCWLTGEWKVRISSLWVKGEEISEVFWYRGTVLTLSSFVSSLRVSAPLFMLPFCSKFDVVPAVWVSVALQHSHTAVRIL